MKTKLLAGLLCALSLAFCLTACVGQIEDTNSEDTSLCVVTDEDITEKKPSYSAVGMVRSQANGKQTVRVNQLSGVYEMDAYTAEGDTLTITLSTTLYEGNLRVVLLCDGTYLQDISVGEAQTVVIPNANGKYQIRLAAESAKLDATLTVTEA